jgi:hypothetical protein
MPFYCLADTKEFKRGFKAEVVAQQIIKQAMHVDITETCDNSDYDFKDSNNITYEVKADGKSHLTRKFFIEYGQQTLANAEFQSSGISKSKADYYMITYGESFYKIKTDVIRYLMLLNLHYNRVTYTTNRGEQTRGILVVEGDLKPHATIYKFEDWTFEISS